MKVYLNDGKTLVDPRLFYDILWGLKVWSLDLLWSHTANLFPVMKTRFSLCTFFHREISVMKTGPCNENRISLQWKQVFPYEKEYTGKTLFRPCIGPVRDCSARLRAQEWLMWDLITHRLSLTNLFPFGCQKVWKRSGGILKIQIHIWKWVQPIAPSFRWKGSNECAITQWIRQ